MILRITSSSDRDSAAIFMREKQRNSKGRLHVLELWEGSEKLQRGEVGASGRGKTPRRGPLYNLEGVGRGSTSISRGGTAARRGKGLWGERKKKGRNSTNDLTNCRGMIKNREKRSGGKNPLQSQPKTSGPANGEDGDI